MNLIYKIASFILSLILMVALTGFGYIKHVCLESGNVHITFNADLDCCGDNPENCCMPIDNCCSKPGSSEYTKNAAASPAGHSPYGCNLHGSSSSGESLVSIAAESSHDGCCHNEVNYLRTGTNYTLPGKNELKEGHELPSIELHFSPVPDHNLLTRNSTIPKHKGCPPPGQRSPGDLLIQHSVLLI